VTGMGARLGLGAEGERQEEAETGSRVVLEIIQDVA
jgi:hypothetical protein